MNSDIIKSIENGECSLGIELGSTRIKGILITPDTKPVASGAFDWENRNEGGVWIYTIDDILTGIHDCYQDLKKDVLEKYGIKLTKLKNMGVSAMMHGYMAFDKDGEQVQGMIYCVVITAFESDTILTYGVIHQYKIYMLKGNELTKIKDNGD